MLAFLFDYICFLVYLSVEQFVISLDTLSFKMTNMLIVNRMITNHFKLLDYERNMVERNLRSYTYSYLQ